MDDWVDYIKDPFDGKGRLLSDEGGKRTWICEDSEQPGRFHLCSVEWTGPLFEENKLLRNEAPKKWGDHNLVASWDAATYFQKVLPARLNNDDNYVKKLLNNSENVKFSTPEGRH